MIKNKGIISIGLIIAIVLGVIVIGGGAYYFGKSGSNQEVNNPVNYLPTNPDQNSQPVKQNQPNVDNKSPSADITCKDFSNYFVVSKSLASETGTDILIKYKNSNKNIICDYIVDGTDFEIKDNGSAEYFYDIKNNLLLLDSGTGPENRGITIYNLDTRKKVFDDIYNMNGVDNISIKNNIMTYWSTKFKQPATKQNCPQYYNSGGAIVSHISVDLSTLVRKDLMEDKCVYQE